MRYKVVRCSYLDAEAFSVIVEGGMEKWNSLTAALNELGFSGWEIATQPFETEAGTGHFHKTFELILCNRNAVTELEQRTYVDNLQRQLANLEDVLAAKPSAVDANSQSETIESIRLEIQRVASGTTANTKT